MGSFAATCGISGLGINAGDKVKFLLLKDRGHDDNIQCYVQSKWEAFVFPFDAKYNDYGSIEDWDPEDPLAKFAFHRLREELVERPVGENQYHDVAVSRKDSPKDLLNALWEARVLTKNWDGKKVQIRPCIIRADVWALAMKQTFKFCWTNEVCSLKATKAKVALDTAAMIEDFRKPARARNLFLSDHFNVYLGTGEDGSNMPNRALRDAVIDKTMTDAEIKEFEPAVAELRHMMSWLAAIRTALYPSHTIGEQVAHYKNQIKWHQGLAKVAQSAKTV